MCKKRTRLNWRRARSSLVVLCLTSASALATEYTINDLGTLPGCTSYPVAINAGGDVAGICTGATGPYRAFIWQSGTMTEIPGLDGYPDNFAFGMNDRGQVVGEVISLDSRAWRAYVWDSPGGTRALSPGTNSTARAINSQGDIVGSRGYGTFGIGRAVLWTHDGQQIDLGALVEGFESEARGINDDGDIVGEWFRPLDPCDGPGCELWPAPQAFLYADGAITQLAPDVTQSYPRQINNTGSIVGSIAYGSYPAVGQGVLWRSGSRTYLGTLPGHSGSAGVAINNNDQIVAVAYRTVGSDPFL